MRVNRRVAVAAVVLLSIAYVGSKALRISRRNRDRSHARSERTQEREEPAPREPRERTEMIPVAGTELFVRTVGEGPPLLVIHGGPVLDHGYLHRWLLPLAKENQLIFYDQRLSGRSSPDAPSDTVSLRGFVADIEALRIHAGAERISILAHSWGGLLGMLYAARHPERVEKLVLVGSMAPSAKLRAEEDEAQRAAQDPEDRALIERLRATQAVRDRTPEGVEALLIASFRSQFHDPAKADELQFAIDDRYADRSRRFAALGPELKDYDVTGELERIVAPTLLIYGADEPGATRGGAELERRIPDAELAIIPDAGHFPFIERPALFQAKVGAFLRSE